MYKSIQAEASEQFNKKRLERKDKGEYWRDRLTIEAKYAFDREPDSIDVNEGSITIDGLTIYWQGGDIIEPEGWVLKKVCPDCGKTLVTPVIRNLAELGAALEDYDKFEGHTCPSKNWGLSDDDIFEIADSIVDQVCKVLRGEMV